jgi:hypothetical protein
MKSFVKVGAILALSVLVVSAFAQGGGGGGRGGRAGGQGRMMMQGGGQGEAQLLGRKDVQTELKITAEQRQKVQDAIEKAMTDAREGIDFQGMRDMSEDERNAMMTKMRTAMQTATDKALEANLTKEQNARLKELAIQRAGNSAVFRADVQKALVITDEQKKKLDELQRLQREAMRNSGGGNMRDMSEEERAAARAKQQEANKKNQEIMNTKIGEILTTEQKDKLKTLGGAAFKFDPAEDNVRRGGGGGRGGN